MCFPVGMALVKYTRTCVSKYSAATGTRWEMNKCLSAAHIEQIKVKVVEELCPLHLRHFVLYDHEVSLTVKQVLLIAYIYIYIFFLPTWRCVLSVAD